MNRILAGNRQSKQKEKKTEKISGSTGEEADIEEIKGYYCWNNNVELLNIVINNCITSNLASLLRNEKK